MSDDQSQNLTGPDPEQRRSKYQVPEAFQLQDLIAEAYKNKMARLKRGGKSGITGDFHSAAALFIDETEIQPPPRLDLSQMEPSDDNALPRIVYLAHQMRIVSRDLLNFYLDECQAGRFGPEIQAQPDPNDEVFSALIKELACVNIVLAGFEQLNTKSPAWVLEYLDAANSFLDRLIIGPSSTELKLDINTRSLSDACRGYTANLCKQLGFGILGDPCWNFIYFKIKGAGQLRYEALKSSLDTPMDAISLTLQQL